MIDFQNGGFFKLQMVQPGTFGGEVAPFLTDGEQIVAEFRGARDGVVFTTKRIIAINIQGLTGKKRDYTSLPFSKIQSFSVETAGHFDLDAELDLWFSGIGAIRFEFAANCDVHYLCRIISDFVL